MCQFFVLHNGCSNGYFLLPPQTQTQNLSRFLFRATLVHWILSLLIHSRTLLSPLFPSSFLHHLLSWYITPSVFRNSSDPTTPFLCCPLHQNCTEALSLFFLFHCLLHPLLQNFSQSCTKIVSLSLFCFLNLQIMYFISS